MFIVTCQYYFHLYANTYILYLTHIHCTHIHKEKEEKNQPKSNNKNNPTSTYINYNTLSIKIKKNGS